jgi:hypothetical protein
MTATEYLAEIVDYGGEQVTRGAMIADLQRVAETWTSDPTAQRNMVSVYLLRHAREVEAQARKEALA